MNELTINLQNVSEEDKKVLLAILEKSQKKESKVWKPKDREQCYRMYCDGEIGNIIYDSECNSCKDGLSLGFIAKTKQELLNKREKLKIEKRLEDFVKEYNDRTITWDGEHDNWYIYYDFDDNEICLDWENNTKSNSIYFSSKEIAQFAINYIGEDRLKKYWFGLDV